MDKERKPAEGPKNGPSALGNDGREENSGTEGSGSDGAQGYGAYKQGPGEKVEE